VRAVNLIPQQERVGGSLPGASAYVAIGALALALAAVTFYVLTGNSITDRRAELARVKTQAAQATARAATYAPYVRFTSLEQARTQTVSSIAASRFDWHRTLSELAQAIPSTTSLSSLTGTVTPSVNLSSSSANPLRGAISSPAVSLQGCTSNFDDVARLISRLRTLSDVERVSLSDSSRVDNNQSSGSAGAGSTPAAAPASGGSGGGNGSACAQVKGSAASFDMVVFFKAPPAAAAPAATAGAGTATTTAATGATPTAPPTTGSK
jgi:Tfp pilus assembly protein PilN